MLYKFQGAITSLFSSGPNDGMILDPGGNLYAEFGNIWPGANRLTAMDNMHYYRYRDNCIGGIAAAYGMLLHIVPVLAPWFV